MLAGHLREALGGGAPRWDLVADLLGRHEGALPPDVRAALLRAFDGGRVPAAVGAMARLRDPSLVEDLLRLLSDASTTPQGRRTVLAALVSSSGDSDVAHAPQATSPLPAAPTVDRQHPLDVTVADNLVLTGRGSTKETRHIELSFEEGAAAAKIESQLRGMVPILSCGTLDKAVNEAANAAHPGEIVLLAPACSSYDQFENYEHRGRVFKELVGERRGWKAWQHA